ncbi:MAG TPA: energy transducer TonB [Candidatus Solibacter sp.]
MRTNWVAAAVLAALPVCHAADVSKLLAEGAKLSEGDTVRLEGQVSKKPEDHVRLAAYWTQRRKPDDRARHILWLIENAPKNEVFQYRESRIYPAGPLGDRVAFEKGCALWKTAVEGDRAVRENAVEWMRTGDPEEAAPMVEAGGNARATGYFYGEALLGITARDFQTGDPVESSAELRDSAFARRALELIGQSQDPALVSGAAFGFGVQAGVLYAAGKLDWDYTGVLGSLIEKVKALDPANLEPYAIATELPRRGEWPPSLLRIAGNVMQKKVIAQSQVAPVYPVSARRGGVQGTVRFNVLVRVDGSIGKMIAVSGPAALVQAAAQAVRNWRYEPTLLNGRPCYVLTAIDVNFTLSR